MFVLNVILLSITVLDPGLSYVLGDSQQLEWPQEYHLKGEKIDILTSIVRPFEIWYSTATNRSRIDYDGGIIRHYYVAGSGDLFGKEFMINPVTTEEETNKFVCTESMHEGKQLSVLPSTTNYTRTGHKEYNDKLVEVWELNLLIKEDVKSNIIRLQKILYVYKNEDGITLPVLEEVKKHNLWTGVVDSHTITRYYSYAFSVPEDETLDHNQEEACNSTSVVSGYFDALPSFSSDVEDEFIRYIISHDKKYEGDEHEIRRQIFMENRRRIIMHNQQNLGYKLTLNKFSDRTNAELAYLTGTFPTSSHVGSVPFPHSEEEVEQLLRDLPESFDMRIEGVISSVKNQGDCGSCWAFSSVAAVEGALARRNGGRNIDLSEQSMVDCAWGFYTFGCKGGLLDEAYKYILKHGIPSEMEYGLYSSQEGLCKLENMTGLYRIRSVAAIPPLSVNAMKVALYKYGPVTVTINANKNVLAYDSGIFYDPECNTDRINHGVTVVGYGVRDGVTYWIVKNSWGEDWGEDGYILFSATDNNCHILENAIFPIV